jgi:hypothetical protein
LIHARDKTVAGRGVRRRDARRLSDAVTTGPSVQARDEKAVKVRNHWRHHDGHWSYWYEPDRRWYYTDGTNWFYQGDDDDAWRVYRFDRDFGREDFERGDYRVPGEGVKIEIPKHHIQKRR